MRVTRKKESFAEVIIVLETQEEVDAFFALGCFNPISDISNIYACLRPFLSKFSTKGYILFREKLEDMTKSN